MTQDTKDIDARVIELMQATPVDIPRLSRTVLSEIARQTPHRPPLAEVLIRPLPVTLGFGGALIVTLALGWGVIGPLLGDDLALALITGSLLPGGF
ncbi:hypothetical protein [Thioclava sp. GXIMD4215]|uniref:hypothetical protein n=1 Tax=Thioclava sp. GXIMD4215 TaxID=3131928 RepID=UPI0032532122